MKTFFIMFAALCVFCSSKNSPNPVTPIVPVVPERGFTICYEWGNALSPILSIYKSVYNHTTKIYDTTQFIGTVNMGECKEIAITDGEAITLKLQLTGGQYYYYSMIANNGDFWHL